MRTSSDGCEGLQRCTVMRTVEVNGSSSRPKMELINQEKWRKRLYRVLSRPMYEASSARKKSKEQGSRVSGD